MGSTPGQESWLIFELSFHAADKISRWLWCKLGRQQKREEEEEEEEEVDVEEEGGGGKEEDLFTFFPCADPRALWPVLVRLSDMAAPGVKTPLKAPINGGVWHIWKRVYDKSTIPRVLPKKYVATKIFNCSRVCARVRKRKRERREKKHTRERHVGVYVRGFYREIILVLCIGKCSKTYWPTNSHDPSPPPLCQQLSATLSYRWIHRIQTKKK